MVAPAIDAVGPGMPVPLPDGAFLGTDVWRSSAPGARPSRQATGARSVKGG